MGFNALQNINNKTQPTQKLCQFTQSTSSHIKSPPINTSQSNAIKKRKAAQTRPSYCFSCQFVSQIEILSWTLICVVIMIAMDRSGVNCTMLNGRMTSDFEVNEWIEDDLTGDSDSYLVEKGDDTIDMDRLQNIIMQGLNLTRIPDVTKVSQAGKCFLSKPI